MVKKDLFRLIAIPALAVVGVFGIEQTAQAGACYPIPDPTYWCAEYFDPVYGHICVNNPAEGTGFQYMICA